MVPTSEYDYDIFISYSHDDNSTHQDDKRNWVSLFEHYLRVRAMGHGYELKIFRDAQLEPFTGVNEQLANTIAHSAIFVCVVSPNYAKSKWCLWELKEMIQRGGQDRILRIGKYPLDDSELSPEQRALLRQTDKLLEARFYEEEESTQSVIDLQPELIPEHLTEFYKRMNPIVDHIIAKLKKLHPACAVPNPALPSIGVSGENQVAVYLAETSKDLVENERELIRSELAQFNYRVLPDQPLPRDAGQLQDAIRNYLQQAKLSVHLIGASYGDVLDGEERSIPHIQYDLAMEMNKQGRLTQIVWLSPDIVPKGRLQQDFIADLKNTSAEYVQAKLEDLKVVIKKKLQPDAPTELEESDGNQINVCLYYHNQDKDTVKPLYSYLVLNQPFTTKLAPEDAKSLQSNIQLLQRSDAILLYYGVADDEWLGNLWRQIKKYTSKRSKPIVVEAIYAASPHTDEKEMLVSDDPVIIKNFGQFNAETLAPFIERIKAAKGGGR